MKEAYEKKYHEVERTHFWFVARRKYILQSLKRRSRDASILDIGCSSGLLLNELAGIGFHIDNLFGVDISPKAVQNCKDAGINNTFVMDAGHIDLEREFDVAIASDCLEHLENDEKALKNWYTLLKPGGTLYVFVPAFMILWNNHDIANMHFRRYTKRTLNKKLYSTGFEIDKSSYWNFFLFLPVLLARLLKKIRPSDKGNATGDLDKIPKLNNWLFHLINFENKLLKYVNLPFGVSTYCIARKPVPKQ